jgi:hypothetical protein
MRSDTFFSTALVTALVAVGAAAATTLGAPAGRAAAERQAAVAAARPASVTMPTVLVVGKRPTQVAAEGTARVATRVE